MGRLGQMRGELAQLRARYDCGQVAPAVYQVIRNLEADISWTEHHETKPTARTRARAAGPIPRD